MLRTFRNGMVSLYRTYPDTTKPDGSRYIYIYFFLRHRKKIYLEPNCYLAQPFFIYIYRDIDDYIYLYRIDRIEARRFSHEQPHVANSCYSPHLHSNHSIAISCHTASPTCHDNIQHRCGMLLQVLYTMVI